MERLQPLDAEETHMVCIHWLSQTADGAQAAILQLLRGCRNAAELAAAETKLRAAIQDWRHSPHLERAQGLLTSLAASYMAHQASLATFAAVLLLVYQPLLPA